MIQIGIQTAQGFVSFTPAADGKTVTVEYRPSQGPWETVALPGLEEAIRAIVQDEIGSSGSGGGTTPTPPSGIVATEDVAYVAAVKAALEAQGVSLAGGCGAFEVVANVAYGLRFVGYGLLEKASGNQCQGYATDVIVAPNRIDIVDVLSDSGGQNIPSWHVKPNEVTNDRWRAPIMPPHPV
jgi:hypothetical protein